MGWWDWIADQWDEWRRGPALREAAAATAAAAAEAQQREIAIADLSHRLAVETKRVSLYRRLISADLKARCRSCGDLSFRWSPQLVELALAPPGAPRGGGSRHRSGSASARHRPTAVAAAGD